jgi:hypothetical protein
MKKSWDIYSSNPWHGWNINLSFFLCINKAPPWEVGWSDLFIYPSLGGPLCGRCPQGLSFFHLFKKVLAKETHSIIKEA